MRILIIQLKRIGDFILTAPAVASLREAYPTAEIVMVVPKNVAGLARCLGDVSRVIAYDSGRSGLEAWGSAIAGEWDACFDFTGTDRSAFLVTLSRAKQRIGYAKFARGLRKFAYTKLSDASVRELHTVDFHLALVETLTGQKRSPATVFNIPPEIRKSASAKLAEHGVNGAFAIVHPGTAREDKFWLDDRWAEVIATLHQRHHLPVVVTGAGDGLEKPHLAALKRLLKVPVIDLTGQLSLVELAVLIARCRIILGVDSMAMHLASVLKKPQVALFGPTNPYHWRPRHSEALVVIPDEQEPVELFQAHTRKRDMNHLSTESVVNAMERLLSNS